MIILFILNSMLFIYMHTLLCHLMAIFHTAVFLSFHMHFIISQLCSEALLWNSSVLNIFVLEVANILI